MAKNRYLTDEDDRLCTLIVKARKDLGISQAELAKMMGVTRQRWGQYETGENRISAALFIKMCRLLEVKNPYDIANGGTNVPAPGWIADMMLLRSALVSVVYEGNIKYGKLVLNRTKKRFLGLNSPNPSAVRESDASGDMVQRICIDWGAAGNGSDKEHSGARAGEEV